MVASIDRLAKTILPIFPQHTCYVDPFCGAAALYFMKHQAEVEVLNDINSELINMYRVVKHHLDEFIRQFRWSLTSRELYKWLQITPVETLTDIQRAARFYYLQKLAFGGKVANQNFGTATTTAPRLNLLRIEEDLSQAHMRLSQTYIEHMAWLDCVRKYDREYTLFYCDPPYWGTEGYGVDFGLEQYILISELARSIKGKMIISVNNTPEMHEAFNGLPMQSVKINYTVGGQKGRDERTELVIRNF